MLFVNFKAYNNYVTDSLYQWDINQKLNIVGLQLTDAPEVHFANSNMERAIVRQATINNDTITVTIPNSLLQAPLPLTAYVGIYEGETFKIIESVKIPVIPKQKPTDYVFVDDEGEIYSYNKILNKMLAFENKYGGIDFNTLKECEEVVTDLRALETRITPIELGGTGAKNAEQARANLGCVDIEVGSYTGTGNYTTMTITLNHKPKVLFIKGTAIVYGTTNVYVSPFTQPTTFTWNENTISWTGVKSGATITSEWFDTAGETYDFYAIY